jgi:integrase/recombinase XerD
MTDSTALTTHENTIAVTSSPEFDRLVEMIAPTDDSTAGIVAPSSARVYRATYESWAAWAADNGVNPLDVNFSTVGAYLADRDGTKASKQRELSALRTLAKTLQIVDYQNPARAAAYESLKLLKVRATGESRHNERERRALSPADADRLLRVWQGDDTPRGKRNRALVAVLLLAGLRREELTALTWQDIDFQNGVIRVKHGKGDKARDAALYGGEALDALKGWQMEQPTGYKNVFVNLRKGGHFTGSAAMSTTAVWKVVDETADRAGIGHVKPHDLRRTLATELLETGSPVHHVQQQLGHADSSTTLNNYTGETDARQRRKAGRVRYG